MMNRPNFRSPFGRQCAQLKESASGLTPELPVHVVLVSPVAGSAVAGSAVVGFAAASSSGAGTEKAMVQRQPHLVCFFSGLPTEVSSWPAVVVTKKLRILLVPAMSSRRFFSRFFCSPEGIGLHARSRSDGYSLHHNDVEQELQDTFKLQRTQLTTLHQSMQSTIFPHCNGLCKKKSE